MRAVAESLEKGAALALLASCVVAVWLVRSVVVEAESTLATRSQQLARLHAARAVGTAVGTDLGELAGLFPHAAVGWRRGGEAAFLQLRAVAEAP